MRNPRALIGVTSLALAATCVLAGTTVSASAVPATPEATSTDKGRGPASASSVAPLSKAQLVKRAAESAVAGDAIDMPSSYPYQPDLKVYRDNADDAAHTANLIGHPEIAPKLLDLMEQSDRISTQVVGQSSEGRDLYLVTVTAPETAGETAQQDAWKAKIKSDPVAAAADTKLLSDYKTPVWISNNIHGNEWEGTDAAMQYIEFLATAPISQVRSILANNRLYFSPSLNPDGRTNATRATALGLDPNRDMITNTTPETRSFIRQAQAIQPIYAADFHGYTGVLQMEPTGPPHGSNYEYDLYIPHNYALALKVEKDVIAKQIPGNPFYDPATDGATTVDTGFIKIPYRDTPDGWDDFPPIFTAQYAAFYGAASATVELPKTRNAPGGRQSPANAVINTTVALETMESIVEYMNVAGNAKDMLKNQIETFRRGVSGEPKTSLTMDDVSSVPGPAQWKPLWDVKDDQEPVTLPRAYVIPVGDDQRSSSDAARLVDQLLLHDIEVGTLASDTTVEGKQYPKGSYVIDMHQPLRGLVNSLFDLGDDISGKFDSMYDVSAWSYSHTWGATVDKIGLTTDGPIGQATPIASVPSGASAPSKAGYTTFEVDGVTDFKALNSLLDKGAAASLLDDGTVVVGPEHFDEVVEASQDFDIAVDAATGEQLDALDDPSTKGLKDLKVAYTGTQDDKLSLTELGFDELVQVSAATINANPAILSDVDLIWGSSTLSFNANTQVAGRDALAAYFARGGSIVGTSGTVTTANTFGLIAGTATSGPSNANGIVDVDTTPGSFLQQYAADTSFVYRPYWFTGLGENVTVEQSYDAESPLLAGHWRESTSQGVPQQNGPANAAGKPAAISATGATGSKVYAFGTSPFWRTFPKGLMSQAARAIFWAAPAGDSVVAPGGSRVTIAAVKGVTYPGAATVNITAADADNGALDGTVVLKAGTKVLATGETSGGKASLKISGLKPGTTSVTASFTPTSARYTSSVSPAASIVVAKASSSVKLGAKLVKGTKKVKVTVTLNVTKVPTSGSIVTFDKGKKIRTFRVTAGKPRTVTLTLKKGTRRLQAVYSGSSLAKASRSKVVKVTIR